MFHRWVVRVATFEAALHVLAYTVEAFISTLVMIYYSFCS